jgi:hypothetical protein
MKKIRDFVAGAFLAGALCWPAYSFPAASTNLECLRKASASILYQEVREAVNERVSILEDSLSKNIPCVKEVFDGYAVQDELGIEIKIYKNKEEMKDESFSSKVGSVFASRDKVVECNDINECFEYIKNEAIGYVKRLEKHHGSERWERMTRIYSGATLNGELGLGIIVYQYKEKRDEFYVLVVASDKARSGDKADRYRLIGDTILSTSLESVARQLRIAYQHPTTILGLNTARNVTLDYGESNEAVLYCAAPYHKEGKGYGSLNYSIKVKKIDNKIQVSGQGNGKHTLENFLD